MARLIILDGPNTDDLFAGLMNRDRLGTTTVILKVQGLGRRRTPLVSIRFVNKHHCWWIRCQSPDYSQEYEGWYDARTRTGYLVEVDRGLTIEQTVLSRLSDAMRDGATVRVTFKPQTNGSQPRRCWATSPSTQRSPCGDSVVHAAP